MGPKRYLAVLAPVVLLIGCQALTQDTESPTGQTKSLTPISVPVVGATPTPSPSPSTTPSPSPSASPSPSPSATPTPAPSASCSLGASNPSSPSCTDDPAQLWGTVDAALTAAVNSRPALFNLRDKKCDNCYRVVDVAGYIVEVQRQLTALGVCARYDGEEMAVKDSNGFSEQYDILTADNYMRRGAGNYRGVCRPAIF